MSFVHGRNTYFSLNAVDLSAFAKQSEFTREADSHDVTTYGQSDHVFSGGLGSSQMSVSGVYDDGVTGPRDVIEPLVGTVVTAIRRPEGTGTGKPQDSVQVLVMKYVETSPVADMVAWSVELQGSGPVTSTNQA